MLEVQEEIGDLMTYEQCAAFLAVPVNTLYSMVNRRQLPFVRLSKRLVRFSRRALAEWVRERSVAVRNAEAPK